ncbi:venom protease isoform X3 [Leptopilina boulardi]|uniref:venom protease isoform X3 n=1 Tax=Leptopilina boulardi TaxID=63433 RepID=UPI0021F690EC|nr:venom protease isoform X3 [Leptopilina boulardi]
MMVMKSCHSFLIGIILILRTNCQTTEENKFSAETKLSTNFQNSDAFLGAVLAVEQDSLRREINRTDSNLNLIRKRRFVRFPSGSGYAFEGQQHPRSIGLANMRFGPQAQFSTWRQQKSFWRPPPVSGGPPPIAEFTRPVMGHRTPRLIFRDNDFPATTGNGVSSNFFQSNQLPEIEEEIRGCGISATKQTAQRRIVGGDEAGFGSFPWQAYIRIGSSRCGGTLVNRFHVVTAGHCVAKASARQVQVTLGDYVVNSASESLPAYTFGVREIRVHPYFKFTPQADRFDVAVLRLDRPVHYMPHIAPICLPEKNEDFLGQYGWAAGWGALQAGSRLRPKTLQAVDVPVIDNRVCERWHRSNGINVVIYDEMMCAGYRGGGKDSCQGDSGGPLMLEKTGRWYLIGIVSAGYSCAQPGQPGIYHRVAKTVDWITYVINS